MTKNKILEIKYYFFPFFIFTFVLIVFQNLFVFLLSILIFIVYYSFFTFKYKNLNFLTIIFIIASLCLSTYLLFMKDRLDKLDWYTQHFTTKDYTIIDILRAGDYLVEDDFNWNFILKKVKNRYKIWDKIRVYWSFHPLDLWFKNFDDFRYGHFLSTRFDLSKIKNIFNFDYNNYLMMKWITATIYARKTYFVDSKQLSLHMNVKTDIKDNIDKIYQSFDSKYKALILWIFIWDKSFLSDEIYKQFIYSWLVHIIVVSWSNIMFLIIFLGFVLILVPFYLRLIIIAFCIVFYAFIAWLDSSVIRAVIMWLLSLIALFFWKLSDTRRILAFAFMIMLVYNPYFLLYDLWFILSFLAIIWILFAANFSISSKTSITNFYNKYMLPTFWACLFTAPAVLLFTHKINVFVFFSSILVLPLLPFLLFANFIILASFWYIQNFFLQISIWIMDWIFYISYIFWSHFTYFISI